MGLKSRTKGKAGEREIAALLADLTGLQVKRRVRQHDGDSDLEGVPGWCIEVKRHARASRANIRNWWAQAVEQSERVNAVPVLLYRQDRDDWRAVWPLAAMLVQQPAVRVSCRERLFVVTIARVSKTVSIPGAVQHGR